MGFLATIWDWEAEMVNLGSIRTEKKKLWCLTHFYVAFSSNHTTEKQRGGMILFSSMLFIVKKSKAMKRAQQAHLPINFHFDRITEPRQAVIMFDGLLST